MREERANANRVASLGLLAGGIAHDFNNILMSVMANISMARARTAGGDAHARALAEAERACARSLAARWAAVAVRGVHSVYLSSQSPRACLRIEHDLHLPDPSASVSADESRCQASNVHDNAQQAIRTAANEITAANIIEPGQRWE